MNCRQCAAFQETLSLRGPAEFESVVHRVRQAVVDGRLEYLAFESDHALARQPTFLALDPGLELPDFMLYHFACTACGRRYALSAETYHGAGGSWTSLG